MNIEHHEGTNTGGICPELRVIKVSDISSFPDVINGAITSEISASGDWTTITLVPETAHPVENRKVNAGRKGYGMRMNFNVAQLSGARQLAIEELERFPVVVDYTDRNGVRRLIGTKKEGAMLQLISASPGKIPHDRNQFDIVVTCSRRVRSPFYAPV